MESLSKYFSKVFKKSECENQLDSELNDTKKLRPDSDATDPNRAWKKRRKYLKAKQVPPMDSESPICDDHLRFVCISDTHAVLEKYGNLHIPDGDVLIHAGDLTMYGHPDEVHLVNKYLGTLPHKHKVVIAGNHDITFDLEFVRQKRSMMRSSFYPEDTDIKLREYNVTSVQEMMTNCLYLQDSTVEISGIKIYGSPWTAGRGFWGFQRLRGRGLMEKWNQIPSDTDILITHSPPCGYGDNVASLANAVKRLAGFNELHDHVGCVDLLNTVNSRVKPQYHVFGHIHEGYGMYTDGTTTFINASTCTRDYTAKNLPIIFDVPLPKGHSKGESCVYSKKDDDEFWIDSGKDGSEEKGHGQSAGDSAETFQGQNVKISKMENFQGQKSYRSYSNADKHVKNVQGQSAQNIGNNGTYDWLFYSHDGKTNYEKLTKDEYSKVDSNFEDDGEDADDDFDFDDANDDDDDAPSSDDDNDDTSNGDNDDPNDDDCNGDGSATAGAHWNKLVTTNSDSKTNDGDSDCDIVFEENNDNDNEIQVNKGNY